MEKGYRCPFCSTFNEFPLWVHAHYDDLIDHTCECGNKNALFNGEIDWDHQRPFNLGDLTTKQAEEFVDRYSKFKAKFDPMRKDGIRIGQAFINLNYGIIYVTGSCKPKLFYEEDEKVANEIIVQDLICFIKGLPVEADNPDDM